MELSFDTKRLRCCAPVFRGTARQEETAECIVPDHKPDIDRIVDASACVLLRSKECAAGKLQLSGSVRASVLYLPEDGECPECIRFDIPFNSIIESPAINPECSAVIQPVLRSVDSRAVNPRKVMVRANLSLRAELYEPRTIELCDSVLDTQGAGVEQKLAEHAVKLPVFVGEKSFEVSDTLELPSGRPAVAEICESRVELSLLESRVVGSRAVFKGLADISVLYLSGDSLPCRAVFSLPFSQMMDLDDADEECDCELNLALTGFELSPADELSDAARTLDLRLLVVAQAVVERSESFSVIEDLYSTTHDARITRTPLSLESRLDRELRQKSCREMVATQEPAANVLDACIYLGEIRQERSGDDLELVCEGVAKILFTGSDGKLRRETGNFELRDRTELAPNAGCRATARTCGEIFASPAAGGVELRFETELELIFSAKLDIEHISAVELAERQGASQRPSLVLRRTGGGEDIWDIAKSYGATAADIRAANSMDADALPAAGQLLLIPLSK